jgi:hypothetical protein
VSDVGDAGDELDWDALQAACRPRLSPAELVYADAWWAAAMAIV